MNPFFTQAKWDTWAFLEEEGLGRQSVLPSNGKEILDRKKVLLKSMKKTATTLLQSCWVFYVGFIFILIFFSFSNLLFKLFHSCFCSWRARGNIPFLTAKPALPAQREPWQPCSLCPHPLPAAPCPSPQALLLPTPCPSFSPDWGRSS